MTLFQAKIDLPKGAVPPDPYDPAWGDNPPDNWAVVRGKDKATVSTYGELVWDRSPYEPDEAPMTLNFQFWRGSKPTKHQLLLARELRWLTVIQTHLREETALSNRTLEINLVALRQVARFCDDRKIRLRDFFAEYERITRFLHDVESKSATKDLARIIGNLRKTGSDLTKIEVVDLDALNRLRTIGRQHKESAKQTAPMPTRIFSAVLSALSNELEEVSQHLDALLAAYAEMDMTPNEAIAKHGLEHFISARGYSLQRQGIWRCLKEIQVLAIYQIQAYSGMRWGEVLLLSYDCLSQEIRNGKVHRLINGRIRKNKGGLIKKARWVTSSNGEMAIHIAQRVADAIYQAGGASPRKEVTQGKPNPLFIRTTFDGSSESCNVIKTYPSFQPTLNARVFPLMSDDDIAELERIDPHRAWRSEREFQIDQPWPFEPHQFRRSLALYAQRSGLVTLPSLKRQLQHLTEEMAAYYYRGSAFAKDFIGDVPDHFGKEWQDTQPVSQYLSYALNVLQSDEELFGAHGNWVNRRLKAPDGIVLTNRDETEKMFKEGRMAYKENFLGGCTNTEECDLLPLKVLDVECVENHCKKLVLKESKVIRVIGIKSKAVERLKAIDPKSAEYRQEKHELEVLETALRNIQNKAKAA